MFGLGFPEIAIILVVIVVFFFGGEKISEIARGLGRFTGEFQKGKAEMDREIKKAEMELKKSGKDLKKPS
jgi:sec-independent protein translocase protein TatA